MELDPKRPGAAHPRVSGENLISWFQRFFASGSSPRERGKPKLAQRKIFGRRLIPA